MAREKMPMVPDHMARQVENTRAGDELARKQAGVTRPSKDKPFQSSVVEEKED